MWVKAGIYGSRQGKYIEYIYYADEMTEEQLKPYIEGWADSQPAIRSMDEYTVRWEIVEKLPDDVRWAKIRHYRADIVNAKAMLKLLGDNDVG